MPVHEEMHDEEQRQREGEIFDRQYEVYRQSYEQRGMSDEEADAVAAEKLRTGQGERGGARRDRE